MPTPRLPSLTALITGSSSGLGRAMALKFASEGASVVCADLQPSARSEIPSEAEIDTHSLIRKQGGKAIFVKTDVTDETAVKGMVRSAVNEWGSVDILINNAGIALESRAPLRLHETPTSTWTTTLSVNATSVFLASKHFLAQALLQPPRDPTTGHRGSIINISSIYGLVGGHTVPSYAASKGAVSLLTKQIAGDYASDGIRCNAICPGHTQTAIFEHTRRNQTSMKWFEDRYPLGLGRPDDVAGVAVFLASEEARWMTGACVSVDGGFTAQ